jgi:hypothetical protein
MRGFETIHIGNTPLFFRQENQGEFLVFNPAQNTGTLFSSIHLLILADLMDGADLHTHKDFHHVVRMLQAIGVSI